ncbi:hypothetical protein [Kitasatospora sp. NPDC088351]|uniref:hypothetical protein n=1 Tax=Kitasatospora sp. NPDC088351 TaxID=3155180 RepID=UPI00343F854E
MPARVRTKRRSSLAPLKLSTLRPSTYNLRPTELHTVVCPDCQTWQQIVGATTLTIRDHYATDLSGAELAAGQRDRRCSSARRVVVIDIDVATWQRAQDRRISPDAMPAEIRRPTKVLRKIPTPKPPALTQLNPAPATAASAHRAQQEAARTAGERVLRRQFPVRRAAEWAGVRLQVLVADTLRELPLEDALGPIRGAEVPTEGRDTREESRARATARSAKVVLAASPVRPRSAA